jgi:hypothetical protein
MDRADALVVVSPEYNHGYSGLLKHVLDSCLKEYIHKAVGIVGVSAGPFGGARVIQNLLPVMRELGLVTIFWDVKDGSRMYLRDTLAATSTLWIWISRSAHDNRKPSPMDPTGRSRVQSRPPEQ